MGQPGLQPDLCVADEVGQAEVGPLVHEGEARRGPLLREREEGVRQRAVEGGVVVERTYMAGPGPQVAKRSQATRMRDTRMCQLLARAMARARSPPVRPRV